MTERKKKEIQGVDVLGAQTLRFDEPLEDVHTASVPIAGCAWIETEDGVVIIDTLIARGLAKQVMEKIRATGKKVKYIIYTHGHVDHVGGTEAFMEDGPEVIASEYLPDRLDGYKMQAEHRARIAAMQFNIPSVTLTRDWVYPTKTFLGVMTLSLGGKTFELHTARAETDDACWIWIPENKCAFIGDLSIGSFPNVGNPWKPTRFALGWAKALEDVRAKEPEYVFCNGAGIVYQGEQAREALSANIDVIRCVHDQVVDYINQDMHITEMIHAVTLPDRLKDSPYLGAAYSRLEFCVFNVYRWYHGYFDHNPANLLPRPEHEVMAEICTLIGDPDAILNRARKLLEDDQAQLGLQVLDVLIQADPENVQARKLRIALLSNIGENDDCLMSRNTWVYFINQDKEFLRAKGDPEGGSS